MDNQGQALVYEFNTGNIQEINKDKFVSFMISAKISLDTKQNLLRLSYREIVDKYKSKLNKLENGIYGFQNGLSNAVIVCLLNKTFDDFRNYCVKNNWPLEKDKKIEVCVGDALINTVSSAKDMTPRYFVRDLIPFIKNNNKLCAIYGIRRTGKTFGIYHCINELLKTTNKIAYITFDENTKATMQDLFNELKALQAKGIQYIFIDEITFISDFYGSANLLSDIYVLTSKIVISGTSSLALHLSTHHVLFGGRLKLFNSTFMSYKEFVEVAPYGKDKTSFDYYLKCGGIFEISKEYIEEKKIDDENLSKYLSESISDNIADSITKFISYDRGKIIPPQIKTLVKDRVKLRTAIEKIIDNQNEQFILDILNNEFSLTNEINIIDNFTEDEIKEIDKKEIIKKIKNKLSIDETKSYDYTTLTYLKKYLIDIQAIKEYTYYLNSKSQDRFLLTQPALRFYQIKTLIETFLNDSKVINLTDNLKTKLKRQILRYIIGFHAEYTILVNYLNMKDTDKIHIYQAHSIKDNGEVDMITYNEDNSQVDLYEIKYINNTKPQDDYAKHISEVKSRIVDLIKNEITGGDIKNRYVLYRGDDIDKTINGHIIKYRNIEKTLKNIFQVK